MADIKTLDLEPYALIAAATSHTEGAVRWTTLEIRYAACMSPRFVARSLGCSRVAGETTRERRLGGSTLTSVTRLFENAGTMSPLGAEIVGAARAWEEAGSFDGTTVGDALNWLYEGIPVPGSIAIQAARDLGITPRPIQKALRAESAGDAATLTVPLATFLRFIDRAAFQQAARQAGAA